MYVQRSAEAGSHNYSCRGKAMSVTYSEFVRARARVRKLVRACVKPYFFSMQNARAVFSSVASLAPSCFSTLSHKRHDFREKKKLFNLESVF